MRRGARSGRTVCLAAAALLWACAPRLGPAPPAAPHGSPRPSLVVVVIVDQLPAGKLEQAGAWLTGGFRRFLDGGRRFTRCGHAHAITETGPGHATLLSGLFPSHNGIVANDWYDRGTHHSVNCVGDPVRGAPLSFDRSSAVTADLLEGENLADLIRRASPASRIYTVAGKDRSAILTGGHHADGVFWYSRATGGFTSSPRFVPKLPPWGARFWPPEPIGSDLYRSDVPAEWTYAPRPEWGPDDNPGESPVYSRVAPHPLTVIDPDQVAPADRAPTIARRVFTSPWVDRLTIELANRLLDRADLGRDDATDLLVVGLSGVDAVGHSYGPDSQEYLDALIRIDGWLDELMSAAGRRGPVLFALSADHGVLPLPETVPGARRIEAAGMKDRLDKAMAARLGMSGEGPFVEAVEGGEFYLDHRTLERLGVPVDRAIDAARSELAGWNGVARVYTAAELSSGSRASSAPADPFLELYRNSYVDARSGDLVIQPCEKCLFASRPNGTDHGTPYDYDRRVPMILLGAGIPAGEDPGECRTVDLAPTLAAWIGLRFETPRDGRPLLGPHAVDSAAPGK